MWEDERNKSGGRWLFNLDKRERKDMLDSCWLETVSRALTKGASDKTFQVIDIFSVKF